MPGLHVTVIDQTTDNPLASKVRAALTRAIAADGKLPPEVLAMPGMSGRKYRLFINNLISTLDDARYLEVGTHAGSTLCSAIHGNRVRALAIDNWSQFGAPMGQFFTNLGRFKTSQAQVSFLETDFRAVDYARIGKFNVYLFDGPHTAKDQYDGLAGAQPALDRHHVLIVDDWNWAQVRDSTMSAIKQIGLTIDFLAEVRTSLDNSHGAPVGAQGDWHNGCLIAAVTKPDDGI